MKKLFITSLIASSLAFLGCAASIVEQKGAELQPFPQAEQLKIKTARTLMLRTETQNKDCDVTTFLQIMSERNPDIQNIIDVHYSQTEKNDKTECSYWGIGVTYEGVETSTAPKASFAEPIKDTTAAQPTDSAKAAEPVKEEVKAEAPAEQPAAAPAEISADTVKTEAAPAAETATAAEATAPAAEAATAQTAATAEAPADSTKK